MANRNQCALWLVVLLTPVAALPAPPTRTKDNGQIGLPAEKRFSGTVEEVTQHECEVCKCVELSVVLNTEGGRLEVKLGPKAFLEEHHFVISRGDSISVTGMRFTVGGKDLLLANDVRKRGRHLVLRGKYGRPAWIEAHGHTCPVCGN